MYRILATALLICGCDASAANGPATNGNSNGNVAGNSNGNTAGNGSGSGIENPTGDCVAPDQGGRVGYHAPDSTDTWLPDCEGSLTMDYFRVFVQANGTAYMIPRPDGSPYLARVCADASHELNAVVHEYALCESATENTVDRVNAMDPADALAVAHYLNDRLVFVAGSSNVTPYVIPEDILGACKTDPAFRTGPLKERCDFEIDAAASGMRTEIGWLHTGAQGVALAAKMNELYGITGEDLCDRLTRDAFETLEAAIASTDKTCTVDADCTLVGRASACHDSCAAVAATSAQSSIDDTRVAIDDSTCAAFEAANCPAVIHPPCIPLQVGCVDGTCVEQ